MAVCDNQLVLQARFKIPTGLYIHHRQSVSHKSTSSNKIHCSGALGRAGYTFLSPFPARALPVPFLLQRLIISWVSVIVVNVCIDSLVNVPLSPCWVYLPWSTILYLGSSDLRVALSGAAEPPLRIEFVRYFNRGSAPSQRV